MWIYTDKCALIINTHIYANTPTLTCPSSCRTIRAYGMAFSFQPKLSATSGSFDGTLTTQFSWIISLACCSLVVQCPRVYFILVAYVCNACVILCCVCIWVWGSFEMRVSYFRVYTISLLINIIGCNYTTSLACVRMEWRSGIDLLVEFFLVFINFQIDWTVEQIINLMFSKIKKKI